MAIQRIKLSQIVASQLPEFVREEYPTFIAFLEAYYEWLDKEQLLELETIRDIDTTLDTFIQYFKSELAHNYPISASFDTERYLLKHVKDQYLAKGSESSYKLLFRLLYGKDVYMDYPGKRMLRASDGRWQQDVSLFVRVDLGDPYSLIGKTVDVQTSKRIFRTEVVKDTQKLNKVTANVENVIQVADNVYEMFLDRNFYGEILSGDVIKYQSSFQGQILPTTTNLTIQNKGVNFKPGMVFQVSTGEGTPIWFKVIKTDTVGGLQTIELIKFGLNYNTDFSVTLLPSSAVSTRKKIKKNPVAISYSLVPDVIGAINVTQGGYGYTQVPDVVIGGNGNGATAHAVLGTGDQAGQVVEIIIDNQGMEYTTAFANVVPKAGDTGDGAIIEVVLGTNYSYTYNDTTNGFTEGGYLNYGDYWYVGSTVDGEIIPGYSDGAYVGSIARQFFVDAKDTIAPNAALLNVKLGAVARYPGYYKTNDGFLDDTMFIQDSYYYQAFSYVIKIDEQLQSYAAIVRSMLHPSGMAMFGEYSINNNIALSVALESLVKSLGISLYDIFFVVDDYRFFDIIKDLTDSTNRIIDDEFFAKTSSKALEDSIGVTDPVFYQTFTKSRTETIISSDDTALLSFVKNYIEEFPPVMVDNAVFYKDIQKLILTTEGIAIASDSVPTLDINIAYMTDATNTITSDGYVWINPYNDGGYFATDYNEGKASTFN